MLKENKREMAGGEEYRTNVAASGTKAKAPPPPRVAMRLIITIARNGRAAEETTEGVNDTVNIFLN